AIFEFAEDTAAGSPKAGHCSRLGAAGHVAFFRGRHAPLRMGPALCAAPAADQENQRRGRGLRAGWPVGASRPLHRETRGGWTDLQPAAGGEAGSPDTDLIGGVAEAVRSCAAYRGAT